MPLSRSLSLIFALFFALPMWAQQPTTQKAELTGMPKPTRDSQAINILNQAVTAAGGMETVSAVRDYRATGTVMRYEDGRNVQGVVTISGSGVAQLRVDESLSTGIRAETADSGKAAIKNENGRVQNVRGPAPFMAGNFALPHRQLVTLLKDQNLDLSYKGLAQLGGRSIHQIHARRLLPPGVGLSSRDIDRRGKDFFIDAVTFQVIVIQDMVSSSASRQIRFGEYRPTSGILVPFSIIEETGGKITRTFHLDNITFNTGLQKSAFDVSR